MNAWLSARETVSSGVPPSAYSADRLVSKGVWRLVREGNGLGHRQATGHRGKHLVGQRVEPSKLPVAAGRTADGGHGVSDQGHQCPGMPMLLLPDGSRPVALAPNCRVMDETQAQHHDNCQWTRNSASVWRNTIAPRRTVASSGFLVGMNS